MLLKQKATQWIQEQQLGHAKVNYRLRDGFCPANVTGVVQYRLCIARTVENSGTSDELPVNLPDDVEFMPTGRSPLTTQRFFNCYLPRIVGEARRETDTMDTLLTRLVFSVSQIQTTNKTHST